MVRIKLLEQQPFLERLAKGISTLFGTNCEVAVHDLTEGYENTLVLIENSHVSGRHLGDDASEIALQAIQNKKTHADDRYAYLTRTKEGRMLKSSSIYIKDEEGEIVGLFGINYDITDLIMAQNALDSTVSITQPEEGQKIETIATNVSDLLDQLIEEADGCAGKPVAMMSKEDKIQAVQYLNERGAFLIKKAGDKVSRHYDISKYTLYNYLGQDSPKGE